MGQHSLANLMKSALNEIQISWLYVVTHELNQMPCKKFCQNYIVGSKVWCLKRGTTQHFIIRSKMYSSKFLCSVFYVVKISALFQEVSKHLQLPLNGSQLTVKKLEIENKTLKVSYELPNSAEQL